MELGQQSYGEQSWADQEQWAATQQPGADGQADQAGDDLDELEKYFDQR